MGDFIHGFMREVGRFIDAVDWSQRWLWGLGIYFAFLLALLLVFRRSATVQGLMLLILAVHVFGAQPLNAWCGANWKLFATENYFGGNGFFITIVYGLPLLLLGVIAVINLLVGTAVLAANVKRMELQQKAKAAKKKD